MENYSIRGNGGGMQENVNWSIILVNYPVGKETVPR